MILIYFAPSVFPQTLEHCMGAWHASCMVRETQYQRGSICKLTIQLLLRTVYWWMCQWPPFVLGYSYLPMGRMPQSSLSSYLPSLHALDRRGSGAAKPCGNCTSCICLWCDVHYNLTPCFNQPFLEQLWLLVLLANAYLNTSKPTWLYDHCQWKIQFEGNMCCYNLKMRFLHARTATGYKLACITAVLARTAVMPHRTLSLM